MAPDAFVSGAGQLTSHPCTSLAACRDWEIDIKELEAAGIANISICYATLAAACVAFSNALRHPRRSKKLLASGGTIFAGAGPACHKPPVEPGCGPGEPLCPTSYAARGTTLRAPCHAEDWGQVRELVVTGLRRLEELMWKENQAKGRDWMMSMDAAYVRPRRSRGPQLWTRPGGSPALARG